MPPAPTGIGKIYKIPGIVKLLFETPSGFAIFSFDEEYLKKDIEHIWIYFVGNYWHRNIVWLHAFRKFKDTRNVINLAAQTIDVGLTQMLWTHCNADETLVVGSLAYKDLIQKTLGLNCHYEEAVEEVMWGLQNLMHTLVPQETKDCLLPMSLGLNMVLNRHKVDVKKGMLNECIIKKTSKVYDTDLREKAHLRFLRKRFDKKFKELSAVDTKDWNLFKLATALKMVADPHGKLKVGYPHKIFSRNELTAIRRDAPLYQQTVNADLILQIYDDVVTLRERKAELLYELRILVKKAKAALETEEAQEEISENGVDSKEQVDRTCLTADLMVPSQSRIDEGAHSRITGENSMVKQANVISDEYSVETHTTGGNDQDQETIAEGRKQTKGIGGVDNPIGKEQSGNSSEEQTIAILDGVGNDRTAVQTTITVETRQWGNASVNQTGTLNADSVEGNRTEDTRKEQSGNSSEEQTNAILDGVGNDRIAVQTTTTVETRQLGNASVNQTGTLNADSVEGNRPEDTRVEGKMQGKETENTSVKQANAVPGEYNFETHTIGGNDPDQETIGGNDQDQETIGGNDQDQETISEGRKQAEGIGNVDNPKEKEQSGDSSEEILDGVRNDQTAVETTITVETQQCGNASVKQNGTVNAISVEGNRTEDTRTQDAVQHGNAEWHTLQLTRTQDAVQDGSAEWNTLQFTRNGEGRKQTDCNVGLKGDEQKEDIGEDILPPSNGEGRKQTDRNFGLEGDEQKEDIGEDILPLSNSADPFLSDILPYHSLQEGEVHTGSVFSMAHQVVPRSMLPAFQEINELSTGLKEKMQETGNTSMKQAIAIPDEHNVETHAIKGKNQDEETIVEGRKQTEGIKSVVETHAIEGKNQDQETIAEGRKQTKGIDSVDDLKEKEQSENSSEEHKNAILDVAGNGATAVGRTTTEEEQHCGNAMMLNGILNADGAEGKRTEDRCGSSLTSGNTHVSLSTLLSGELASISFERTEDRYGSSLSSGKTHVSLRTLLSGELARKSVAECDERETSTNNPQLVNSTFSVPSVSDKGDTSYLHPAIAYPRSLANARDSLAEGSLAEGSLANARDSLAEGRDSLAEGRDSLAKGRGKALAKGRGKALAKGRGKALANAEGSLAKARDSLAKGSLAKARDSLANARDSLAELAAELHERETSTNDPSSENSHLYPPSSSLDNKWKEWKNRAKESKIRSTLFSCFHCFDTSHLDPPPISYPVNQRNARESVA